MKIKQEGGAYHFWPKGDANEEADGCWIPERHVKAYVVGIERNTVMENALLRNIVNGAKAAAYKAVGRYEERYRIYCGAADESACVYWLSYQQRQEMARLWDVAERAVVFYECWYQNAVDSQYPGHIPHAC